MSLDELFADAEDDPRDGRRGRDALTTFSVAVATGVLGLLLVGVLLYALGHGGVVLWAAWWADFA